MKVHKAELRLKPSTQTLFLVPIGDIQGREELLRFRGLINWALKREAEGNVVRFFGLGDYFETFSPTERASIGAAKLHDTSQETLEEAFGYHPAREFVEIMTPVRHMILGFLEGHHWYNVPWLADGIVTNIRSDEYISHQLKTTYFGDGAVVINLIINGLSFRIVATHGYGTARTPGARLNKRIREREVVLDAHWYVMAHDNAKQAHGEEPFILDNSSKDGVRYHKQYFTGAGSFQRGYKIGSTRASYVEKLMLPPAALGVVICTVKVEPKEKRGFRLDYHVSL